MANRNRLPGNYAPQHAPLPPRSMPGAKLRTPSKGSAQGGALPEPEVTCDLAGSSCEATGPTRRGPASGAEGAALTDAPIAKASVEKKKINLIRREWDSLQKTKQMR
ncbi:elongin-C isoform X3 [Strigops habroptila]|uniref:elongin-C isoform X3 n=1 Tax=Strigops habroptila TaxID=2489341 RepID=UPI0011CF6F17|nr:elongin-C isoform X3 [Strigops habroptila]